MFSQVNCSSYNTGHSVHKTIRQLILSDPG